MIFKLLLILEMFLIEVMIIVYFESHFRTFSDCLFWI
jgi:hypothetical protein